MVRQTIPIRRPRRPTRVHQKSAHNLGREHRAKRQVRRIRHDSTTQRRHLVRRHSHQKRKNNAHKPQLLRPCDNLQRHHLRRRRQRGHNQEEHTQHHLRKPTDLQPPRLRRRRRNNRTRKTRLRTATTRPRRQDRHNKQPRHNQRHRLRRHPNQQRESLRPRRHHPRRKPDTRSPSQHGHRHRPSRHPQRPPHPQSLSQVTPHTPSGAGHPKGTLRRSPPQPYPKIEHVIVNPAITTDTIDINFIKIFNDGPDVSLNGSPTVSPTTADLWHSPPLPP